MTEPDPHGTAEAVLTCDCGRTLTVALTLGSGNDLHVELPEEWYLGFTEGQAYVKCPSHHRKAAALWP